MCDHCGNGVLGGSDLRGSNLANDEVRHESKKFSSTSAHDRIIFLVETKESEGKRVIKRNDSHCQSHSNESFCRP